jgi:hypothetical protein
MAAFLAGVAKDRGGQNLGPLALHDLAETDIFEIRKRVQPARVQSRVRDNRTYQIFQAILCWHLSSLVSFRADGRTRSSTVAEDALEDEIYILQMIAEVKELFEFGVA